jgi:hypothetical protein
MDDLVQLLHGCGNLGCLWEKGAEVGCARQLALEPTVSDSWYYAAEL